MIVLGLDQASHTGYALCDDTGEVLTSGTKVFKGVLGRRLSEFRVWLLDLLVQYEPDVVFYERPHFRGYAATLSGVGMITTIQTVCYETGTPYEEVHSATLKKYATGYGKASKSAMTAVARGAVNHALNVKQNNDEADAIHLAKYGVENWTKVLK